MKKLLILISAACLLLPVMAFSAGNPNPTLYLEIYTSSAHCQCAYVPGGPPIPCYLGPDRMQCYVFVHVAKVPNGFLGIPLGIDYTGPAADFLSATACPGFLMGPSTAGMPAAMISSSTGECHTWDHHPLYTRWFDSLGGTDYFDIVASADLGHYKVINCDTEYDENTLIGGRAQWGGVQDITCGEGETAIELTTWGKIKGLYR